MLYKYIVAISIEIYVKRNLYLRVYIYTWYTLVIESNRRANEYIYLLIYSYIYVNNAVVATRTRVTSAVGWDRVQLKNLDVISCLWCIYKKEHSLFADSNRVFGSVEVREKYIFYTASTEKWILVESSAFYRRAVLQKKNQSKGIDLIKKTLLRAKNSLSSEFTWKRILSISFPEWASAIFYQVKNKFSLYRNAAENF